MTAVAQTPAAASANLAGLALFIVLRAARVA